MKKISQFLFFSLLIISCGQSAQEKARIEKATQSVLDSMAAPAAAAEKAKSQADLQAKKDTLANAKADLAVANDKMGTIKQFQIGRPTSEKEKQIREQTLVIEHLKTKIEDLEKVIEKSQSN